MELIKEIWDKNLPNFGYVIEADNGEQYVVVLGEPFVPKSDTWSLREAIIRRNSQMQQLYRQEPLSDDCKRELAKLVHKMHSLCRYREDGLFSKEEQAAFIDGLSKSEKEQLAYQIQMHKECRSFYREYVF